MKASVGGSPRLHRFNEYPFGFVGVVRGLYPTDFFFMLSKGALENSTLQKHDNMPHFLELLFFNVRMSEKALGF